MNWLLGIAVVLGAFVLLRSAGATRPSDGGQGVALEPATKARVEQWRAIVRSAIAFHAATYAKTSLVLALIARESSGKEHALGDPETGDRGLMQITSPAWTDYVNFSGDPSPPSFDDLWHAEQNVRVGVWFLETKIEEMDSVRDGLRAYNRGTAGAKDDPTAGAAYADWILAVEPEFRSVVA